ncbi:MAG: GAF domain-containing protein [Deltaproteobacteria bacterium]|nr:GAF domain-containing protein [Deltaproteobacteria bacterium]
MPGPLPADFVDRLRDLLSTIAVSRLLLRAGADDSRLERLVALAARLAGAESGALLLIDEDRGDLRVAAAVGPGAEALRGTHLAPGTDVAGAALAGGEPLAVADEQGGMTGGEIERRTGLATRNLLAVPFEVHGVPAGVLELRNGSDARGFDPETIGRVAELAQLAAAAIEDWRGDRFLFALFAAALPRALAPGADPARDGLAEELRRWLDQLRQTPAWRGALETVEALRELVRGGEPGLRLAAEILAAVARRERARRALLEDR